MKIDESCIDHNAVRIITDLVEARYEIASDEDPIVKAFLGMTIGEIAGVLELAQALKEVLKT